MRMPESSPSSVVAEYRVYWQPGCTSCLKAKEFLTRHGIAFESIDVRARPEAVEELRGLGARSIPVVARGTEWTYAQELDDLAKFVGVERRHVRLPVEVLLARLAALLMAARTCTRQLPDVALERTLPGRADRAGADLAYHVAAIVDGFLDAAGGGELTFEHFLRTPSGDARERDALVRRLAESARALEAWSRRGASDRPESVRTYYGVQPLHGVLERTAWHVAQHVRQLESLVREAGLAPDAPLGAAELDGLPLPEGVWDREIGAPPPA
jgi:glutaredoxin